MKSLINIRKRSITNNEGRTECTLERVFNSPLGQKNISSNVSFIEDISAPRTRINLPIASLGPCCKGGHHEYINATVENCLFFALRGVGSIFSQFVVGPNYQRSVIACGQIKISQRPTLTEHASRSDQQILGRVRCFHIHDAHFNKLGLVLNVQMVSCLY
jgi:hypothetical protein